MSGISRTGTDLLAKMLNFTFAGYGLVCDRAMLKMLFNHFRYRYVQGRDLLEKSYSMTMARKLYTRLAERFAGLLNAGEDEKWYYRERG